MIKDKVILEIVRSVRKSHGQDGPSAEEIVEMLRAAYDAGVNSAKLDAGRLVNGSYDFALLVWFIARGSSGAGQFTEPWMGPKCREEFDHWWRDPHGYYAEQEKNRT